MRNAEPAGEREHKCLYTRPKSKKGTLTHMFLYGNGDYEDLNPFRIGKTHWTVNFYITIPIRFCFPPNVCITIHVTSYKLKMHLWRDHCKLSALSTLFLELIPPLN